MIPERILLVAILLLLGMNLGPVPAHPLRAAPALLAQVAADPQTMLRVIVQQEPGAGDVMALVIRLGGRVTRDLHIIHAFSAELPGRAVAEIAATPGVRWISPDAPVVPTGCNAPCINTSNLLSGYPQTVR